MTARSIIRKKVTSGSVFIPEGRVWTRAGLVPVVRSLRIRDGYFADPTWSNFWLPILNGMKKHSLSTVPYMLADIGDLPPDSDLPPNSPT